jgi:hypothetical protein
VADDGGTSRQPLMGQFVHNSGSQFAHLTFLAPASDLDQAGVLSLLEYMVLRSRERGALRLLADVDEQSQVFEALRKGGFAIFTRQRIWQCINEPLKSQLSSWRSAVGQDLIAIRSLYNNLVPGLVQQAEPYIAQRPRGMVYYRQSELLAYVELRSGSRGVWLQPFVHPDAQDIPDHFEELLQHIAARYTRPVYICVRSYQSWLESPIEAMGARVGPGQAVMVKHLAVAQKLARSVALPVLESSQPEITAPVARSESR